MFEVVIEGNPIQKKRHRCSCIGGKPHSYDPQIKEDMHGVKAQMQIALKQALESCDKEMVIEASKLAKVESFAVDLIFVFGINDRSATDQQRALNKARKWNIIEHNIKPDLDNLIKFYLDCATGIFWKDDSQISSLTAYKQYGFKPRVILMINPLEKMPIAPEALQALKIFDREKIVHFFDYLSEMSYLDFYSTYLFDDLINLDADELEQLGLFLFKIGKTFGEEFNKIKKLAVNE